jgi:2Fe-2S ferredoxin
MPNVRFRQPGLDITVHVPVGSSILDAAKTGHVPQGDRCGGVCACSTCHVYVTQGFDSLSEMQDEEFDILDRAFDVRAHSRLGCQAKVRQDIEVVISDESLKAFADEHPQEREQALRVIEAGRVSKHDAK